ncbi:outer membrane protein assembly factor BamB family protein [Nocardiopsis oceani]
MFESPARFWFAVGLLVPASALFGWAVLTIHGVPGEEWTWTVPGILVVAAVSVPVLALIRWDELRGATRRPEPEAPVGTSGAAGLRWRLLAPLPLLFFLAVFAHHAGQAISYTPEHTERVPAIDFSPYGVAWGGAFLVAGLIILSFSPRARGGRRAHRFAGGGAGLAVSSIVFAVVFVVSLLPVADSRPAEDGAADTATAPAPERVSEVAWQWEAPEGDTVSQVIPVGPGAVVRHDSGVAALDTVEGEELWSFRRAGEQARDVVASPDGSLVVVTFLARARTEGFTLRLLALDGHTGEVRADYEAPHHRGTIGDLNLPHGFSLTQEGTYVYTLTQDDPADNRVVARGTNSGEAIWEFASPEDCYLTPDQGEGTRHLLGGEAVVVMQCAPEAAAHTPKYHRYPRDVHDQDVVVLGLDFEDGTEVWRHEESVTTRWTYVNLQLGADQDILALQWPDGADDVEGVGRLFLGPGGEEISRESSDSHAYVQHPTHDGYMEKRESGDEGAFVWRPYTGEERTAPTQLLYTGPGIGRSILDGAVVTVSHTGDSESSGMNTMVSVEPWDDIEGAERREFEVDLVGDRDSPGSDEVTLLPAPGSLLLSADTHLLLGLA